MMPPRTGAQIPFSTDNNNTLKGSRNAEIVIASGRSTAVITLELRIVDQFLESLFVTEVETLGYYITQVIGMEPCIACCIVYLCL
jgi:hypothetical protein